MGWITAAVFFLIPSSIMALAIGDCPAFCSCSRNGSMCTVENLKDFALLRRVDVHSLHLKIPIDGNTLQQVLVNSPSIKFLSINSSQIHDNDAALIFRNSTISSLELQSPMGVPCTYGRLTHTNISCKCPRGEVILLEKGSCLCKVCNNTENNISTFNLHFNLNNEYLNLSYYSQKNRTNATIAGRQRLKPERHRDSVTYSITLGILSTLALVINLIILVRMCSCDGQSVSKIFGLSMMLFNILLAEYGIALAIYLIKGDSVWDRSFCQVMTAVKLFSMCAVIFSILCLTFQWLVNPPNGDYNSQNVRFKAIVYILEGSVLGAMICILSWTKFDDWDYLCQIWDPSSTADKIIVYFEYCYHVTLFLLVLRYPYKTLRRKEPPPKYIKMKDVVEREHPIFVMTLFTFLFWSLPYFVTVPQLNASGYHLTPVIRNSSLMIGALVLPILFVIRNSRICCSKHKACGVNDPHVCQCKGRSSNMCYACELQHQDMISKCDKYSLGDRRKSLSLDDLKFVLNVYQKEKQCSLKIQKRKLTSRSFPLINMDTIEETELEDLGEFERMFPGTKGKTFEISIEAAKQRRPLSRDNSLSLPLLSPKKYAPVRKKIPLHAKLSHSPCKTSLSTPVKQSLEKRRAASFDTSKVMRSEDSSCSDRSTLSSPIKTDDESRSLIKVAKKKSKAVSKSKESIKSKDSVKAKDIDKVKLSKENLQSEAVLTAEVTSPNRVSRVPSFIPLSDGDTLEKSAGLEASPIKNEKRKSQEIERQDNFDNDNETEALLAEDPNRVPSRGPTFFFVGEQEIDNDEPGKDDAKKPLVGKEKKGKEKKSKRKSKKKMSENVSVESTPAHKAAPLGSLHSLEWDPSFSLSDSSCSSPIDEFIPPSPAPPPSNFALQRVKEMEAATPDSPQASIGRRSNYSMDWDPTSVQMRHSLVSPCEWEPYSVEEVVSNPTSPDFSDLEKFRTSVISRDKSLLSSSPDKLLTGKAPLATEEI